MKTLLVFCDVEGPVAIEVPAQVDGSELDDCLGHRLSPAHSRTLHSVLDEILAGALDGATGDGPPLSQGLLQPSSVLDRRPMCSLPVRGDTFYPDLSS